MKIFVFAHSRSGSSLLTTMLSKKYNLEDLEEPFNDDPDIFEKLKDKDNYIIKVTSGCLLYHDSNKIPLDIYDQVYIAEREDKTAMMASTYLSTITNDRDQPEKQEFTIPLSWFLHFTDLLDVYYKFAQEIYKKRPDCIKLEYDEIMQMAKENGYYSKSNLDFKNDCKNYTDMSAKVLYFMNKLKQKYNNV